MGLVDTDGILWITPRCELRIRRSGVRISPGARKKQQVRGYLWPSTVLGHVHQESHSPAEQVLKPIRNLGVALREHVAVCVVGNRD